jgi:hypothetical protein
MSGEKRRYVRVEESQWRRLQEQDSRLRSLQSDLPERLNLLRSHSQQAFERQLLPLQQRALHQAQLADRLRTNLADLERENARRLERQQQEFRSTVERLQTQQAQALQRQADRLDATARLGLERQRQEYLQLHRQQRQEWLRTVQQRDRAFQEAIATERAAREATEAKLTGQLDAIVRGIEAEKTRKIELAESLWADVDAIWQQTDRQYRHEQFAPGQLSALRRQLELARDNLTVGLGEAAIATTQKTYLELNQLRLDLERQEQQWLLLYHAISTDLGELLAQVNAHRECELEIGEGTEAERFKVEVDYWSKGALSEYEGELAALETELKQGERTLTTAQLEAIADRLESLQPRFDEIVAAAKLAILSSQMRAEIADCVVEVLGSLGYTLVNPETDACYQTGDRREAYAVKVKNIAGDEVVTVIAPDRDFGANSISINSFSPTLIDETATRENARAIFQLLDEAGVEAIGELECYDRPREEYRRLWGDRPSGSESRESGGERRGSRRDRIEE